VSNLSDLAADNQGTNTSIDVFLSLFFLCFNSGFSLVIRAQKPTFSRHSFVAISLPLLSFGSRARCRIAPFLRVSNFPNSAADSQRADAPRFLVLSLFCLCFFSALPRVSVSSLSRFFLVFRARKVKFCEVLKCLFLLVFACLFFLGFSWLNH
jgi:hypothetical protein